MFALFSGVSSCQPPSWQRSPSHSRHQGEWGRIPGETGAPIWEDGWPPTIATRRRLFSGNCLRFFIWFLDRVISNDILVLVSKQCFVSVKTTGECDGFIRVDTGGILRNGLLLLMF